MRRSTVPSAGSFVAITLNKRGAASLPPLYKHGARARHGDRVIIFVKRVDGTNSASPVLHAKFILAPRDDLSCIPPDLKEIFKLYHDRDERLDKDERYSCPTAEERRMIQKRLASIAREHPEFESEINELLLQLQ